MGYDNNQYVIARHDDTGYPHYHAIINRVSSMAAERQIQTMTATKKSLAISKKSSA